MAAVRLAGKLLIAVAALVSAVTYWWYGHGTGFLEPADILKEKWAWSEPVREDSIPSLEPVPV